jgi:hypothetical protein
VLGSSIRGHEHARAILVERSGHQAAAVLRWASVLSPERLAVRPLVGELGLLRLLERQRPVTDLLLPEALLWVAPVRL